MKQVAILGATGTIGQNTLDIIAANPNLFAVSTLTAQDNVDKLASLARQFKPKLAVIGNEEHYDTLKSLLADTTIEVAAGENSVVEAASISSDIVMSAIVGAAGLKPTLAAIHQGTTVALANKECLVCAGALMQEEIAKHGATLIPVDSEHSAVFQLLQNNSSAHVERITLTASGGPFRMLSLKELQHVTPEQAIKHPNWNMGAKISVDSATLMNKGLELIEAHYLFGTEPERLDAVIHPQSIIHALVAMEDGSVLAQMSEPDMKSPISYALSYPKRIPTNVKRLDLAAIGSLTFEAPDDTRFPALKLARQSLAAGGNAPTILNAANEIAVARFLRGEIGFMGIAAIVEKALSRAHQATPDNLDELFLLDQDTRRFAEAA